MRAKTVEAGTPRRILIGMIVSEAVLSRIAGRWEKEGLFATEYENLIGSWCVAHYIKYQKAPGKDIKALYESWAEEANDKDMIQSIDRLLQSINGEYVKLKKEINVDLVTDMAADHFNRVSLERLANAISGYLENNQVAKAMALKDKYRPIEMGAGQWIDVLRDEAAMQKAFEDKKEPLIVMPGALGEFFDDSLERDAFVALQAPEKRGKSFSIQEICWQGMLQGRKVAMFQVGDLSQSQIMRRFMTRASRRPMRAGKVMIPTKFERNEDNKLEIQHKAIEHKDPLSWQHGAKSFDKVVKKSLVDSCLLRLSVHANSSISVHGINEYLSRWERDGWSPDVVCLAEGSLVLTNRGLVAIEKVTKLDRLWDGMSWVSHDGPIYKGVKNVIEYGGVTATPDHLFWSEGEWRTFESCRNLGLPLAQTGVGRKEVWLGEDRIAPGTSKERKIERRKSNESRIRSCTLQWLQGREVVFAQKPYGRNRQGLSFLLAAKAVSNKLVLSSGSRSTALSESELVSLEALRGKGSQIQLYHYDGCMFVGAGQFGITNKRNGVGPYREFRPLRAGKYSLVYEKAEYGTYQKESSYGQTAQISFVVPRNHLFRFHAEVSSWCEEINASRSDRKVEGDSTKMRKSRVWDILNAGPLHRFTVQGVLAHNCIDYADILMPINGAAESRDQINATWKQMRRMSQERHCLVLTATQTDADSYDTNLIRRRNFSEDKRKFSHVTGMFAINQNEKEKKLGIQRLNWIVLREGEFSEEKTINIAGSLAIANPMIKSCW